jgi:hypothetical protein
VGVPMKFAKVKEVAELVELVESLDDPCTETN